MQLELLKRRAEKISSANFVSGTKLDDETRVMPGLNFTCDGNITSLLLGVDVRTVDGSRVEYPEVQVWRQSPSIDNSYTHEDQQRIQLSAAGDFSPDGVLQYNLTTPISFQSGDVLGVYQPEQADSVVRLFYINDPGVPVAEQRSHIHITTSLIINPSNTITKVSNQSILLSLITGMGSSFLLCTIYLC